jgi:hypothetical protein
VCNDARQQQQQPARQQREKIKIKEKQPFSAGGCCSISDAGSRARRRPTFFLSSLSFFLKETRLVVCVCVSNSRRSSTQEKTWRRALFYFVCQ